MVSHSFEIEKYDILVYLVSFAILCKEMSLLKQDLYGKCPYVTAQKVLQGKWTILIMHYLSQGPLRFNELLRMLPDMTHATLSKQLKQMEQNGMVIRKEYPQVPPKVEYSLSDIGMEFMPVLDSLELWGGKYIAYLKGEGL